VSIADMRLPSLRKDIPGLLIVGAALAMPAYAQVGQDRPASRPLELPTYAPAEPGRVLPQVVTPQTPTLGGLAAGRTFPVRQVAVSGVTALTAEEVRALVAPFEGREIGYADLEALRLAVTRAYIERGYVTSGARIPDQDVSDGVVRLEVVEGTLTEVTVTTDGRLRPGPVGRRLERDAEDPVNVVRLEEQLQILQQDPAIGRVNAALLPGQRPGESRLEVTLEETPPASLEVSFANQQNPAIGEDAARVRGRLRNLLGLGDELAASYEESDGFEQVEGSYDLPLGSRGTSLSLRYNESESEIIDPAFAAFDITSEAETFGLTLRQSVYRSLGGSVDLFVGAEDRESLTTLLGEGFSFTPGPQNGETKLFVLRAGADATWRGARQVLAARLQGSFGQDARDATRNSDPEVPDAKFTAVLAQLQWATRLPWAGSQLLARVDTQVAADPLFGLEQFAIGGASTVRGFVESALVRDSGVIVSAEVRVPLLAGSARRPRLELAPFVDWGEGWNEKGDSRGAREELAGAGVGLRFGWRWLSAEAYWADPITEVENAAIADSLREDWHFAVRLRWPE
jgi:hemolysin activation/secretion protein